MANIIDLISELNELSGSSTTSIYKAKLVSAEKESNMLFYEHMLSAKRATVAKENLEKGVTKAEIIAKASTIHLQAIDDLKKAKHIYLISQAEHSRRLNRFKAVQAMLIAEQSLAKHA